MKEKQQANLFRRETHVFLLAGRNRASGSWEICSRVLSAMSCFFRTRWSGIRKNVFAHPQVMMAMMMVVLSTVGAGISPRNGVGVTLLE